MVLQNTLDYLLGHWRIERTIEDHATATRVQFNGRASVTEQAVGDPSGARYDESGLLWFGDRAATGQRPGSSHRALILRRRGGAVDVDFPDGRAFIDLDLRSGAWTAQHPCAADHYELGFTVADGDMLEERWRVHGPSKDYEALTIWRRERGGGEPEIPAAATAGTRSIPPGRNPTRDTASGLR